MKILVVLPAARGVYPADAEDRRVKTMLSYATPSTEVVVDFPGEASGFNPYGGGGGALDAHRNHELIAERMIRAEQEGYDACIPFGMLDFGVDIARSYCKIPIIGQARATYAIAATMADRIGVITYQSTGSWGGTRRQLREFGFSHLVIGFGAAEIPNNEMPRRRQELFDNFVSEGKRLVKEGAELIVCGGMSMSPIEFSAKEYADGIGVPVLEGMGCAVAMAEAWHRLGTPYSRVRYPAPRPQAQ